MSFSNITFKMCWSLRMAPNWISFSVPRWRPCWCWWRILWETENVAHYAKHTKQTYLYNLYNKLWKLSFELTNTICVIHSILNGIKTMYVHRHSNFCWNKVPWGYRKGRDFASLWWLVNIITCGTPIFLQASKKFSTFLRHLAMLSFGWRPEYQSC